MLLNLLISTLLSKNFLKIKTLNENTKKDGTLTKISIQPYSQDPKDKDFTIWMFTNENSADAVYGSLDEARWSMECDENGNVLSIWWNEGTCHLMGYDYDKEHFQTLPPFTHLHDKIQQLR